VQDKQKKNLDNNKKNPKTTTVSEYKRTSPKLCIEFKCTRRVEIPYSACICRDTTYKL